MSEESTRLVLLLIGPGTLAIFSLAYLWAWSLERKRHYLLLFSAACLAFAVGVLAQIFAWPSNLGHNALLSNTFYTLSVLALSDGLLRRSAKSFGLFKALFLLLLSSCLIAYYFYVDRNLVMRVYIQNFGFGLILLISALRLRTLAKARFIDRALFWTLLVFSLQFFPRTILFFDVSGTTNFEMFGQSLFWRTLQLSQAVLGSALALVILAAVITDVIEDLRRERDVDRLSGVFNRRGCDEHAERVMNTRAVSLAMVLCDLDHFKSINDRFGHSAGDEVLCLFGAILRRTARKSDIVGRIGGEEFAILLVDAECSEAKDFVTRLQRAIADTQFPLGTAREPVSASFGIAVSAKNEDLSSLFKRADSARYQAKNTGRNKAVFSD